MKVRKYASIEDFVLKNAKPIVLSENKERTIIKKMEEFAIKQRTEEFKAMESAKKIFLNS